MKYSSIRISREAKNILDAYLKQINKTSKKKLTKLGLINRYAGSLTKHIKEAS